MDSIEEGILQSVLNYGEEIVNFDNYLIHKLAERQFKRYEIVGDGHCLLHAIKHQLRYSNLLLPSIPIWREVISMAMTKNVAGICAYFHISGKEEVDELLQHIDNFKYMRSATGIVEWGNEYTIYQICQMYNLHATILSPFRIRSGSMFLHEENIFKENGCDCERIFLCRSNTSHYDSVVDTQVRFVEGRQFTDEDIEFIKDSQVNDLGQGVKVKNNEEHVIKRNEKRNSKRKLNSTTINRKRKQQRLIKKTNETNKNINDNERRNLKRKLNSMIINKKRQQQRLTNKECIPVNSNDNERRNLKRKLNSIIINKKRKQQRHSIPVNSNDNERRNLKRKLNSIIINRNRKQQRHSIPVNSNDNERQNLKRKLNSSIVNEKRKQQRLLNKEHSIPVNSNDNERQNLKRKLNSMIINKKRQQQRHCIPLNSNDNERRNLKRKLNSSIVNEKRKQQRLLNKRNLNSKILNENRKQQRLMNKEHSNTKRNKKIKKYDSHIQSSAEIKGTKNCARRRKYFERFTTGSFSGKAVNEDARKYSKMFDEKTIFQICAVCGIEGPRIGSVTVDKMKEDIMRSGIHSLFQNITDTNDNTTKYHNYFSSQLEDCFDDGLLKGMTNICSSCASQLRKRCKRCDENESSSSDDSSVGENENSLFMPKLCMIRGLFTGKLPVELEDLTLIEESMISIYNAISKVCLVGGKHYHMKGATSYTVINDVASVAKQLPRMPNVEDTAILRHKNTKSCHDYKYRPKKIYDALNWLKECNFLYENIDIVWPNGKENWKNNNDDVDISFIELTDEEEIDIETVEKESNTISTNAGERCCIVMQLSFRC
jgi:hypothetical protein